MKVLLFAFGDDDRDNPHRPHTYERDCVVYTGNHDNNTVRGWFEEDAGEEERGRLRSYVGRDIGAGDVARELILLAMNSPASRAVIPVQDLIGLGGEGRMNRPSTARGNWEWRLEPGALIPALEERLLSLTVESGRTPPRPAREPGRQ
jgi:4-alpha-glucanotransferase